MQEIKGTYYKGKIKLDRLYEQKKPVEVTMILEDEKKQGLSVSDFSFLKAQELLKHYKGSFAEEVIIERRKEQ